MREFSHYSIFSLLHVWRHKWRTCHPIFPIIVGTMFGFSARDTARSASCLKRIPTATGTGLLLLLELIYYLASRTVVQHDTRIFWIALACWPVTWIESYQYIPSETASPGPPLPRRYSTKWWVFCVFWPIHISVIWLSSYLNKPASFHWIQTYCPLYTPCLLYNSVNIISFLATGI